MTISEACGKWNLKSEDTVWDYIKKGYIVGLSTENNQIILPDIPKPHIVGKGKKLSQSTMIKNILKACDNMEYISAYILGLTEEQFELIMTELVEQGYLKGKSTLNGSNMGYRITMKASEYNKRSFKININGDIKPTLNIGLINPSIG